MSDCHRQDDGEGRSLSGATTIGFDLAIMHFDDPFHDRQAKAGGAFTGGGFCGQSLETAEQSS
jgi:hypothetical protein